ncbi:MAG TPA: DJ-1/PfpI family protein [Candidatus Enterenecus stercoripullorum]|nr:DJ-1/PfpI family protein [Candidatus Enterenecus stercoripullorum]
MVYILLAPGFEEAEALVPADLLRRANVPVTLTGVGGDCVTGAHGVPVRADAAVEQVALCAGDMLVLPGGPGVAALEGSGAVLSLIRQAAQQEDLWLAAICAAPTLLARMELLPGRQAVCYPGMEDDLTAHGATPRMECSTVRDGRFITGRAPGSAFDFGLALVEALAGPQTAQQVRAGIHYHG